MSTNKPTSSFFVNGSTTLGQSANAGTSIHSTTNGSTTLGQSANAATSMHSTGIQPETHIIVCTKNFDKAKMVAGQIYQVTAWASVPVKWVSNLEPTPYDPHDIPDQEFNEHFASLTVSIEEYNVTRIAIARYDISIVIYQSSPVKRIEIKAGQTIECRQVNDKVWMLYLNDQWVPCEIFEKNFRVFV